MPRAKGILWPAEGQQVYDVGREESVPAPVSLVVRHLWNVTWRRSADEPFVSSVLSNPIAHLTKADIAELGRELDAIRQQVRERMLLQIDRIVQPIQHIAHPFCELIARERVTHRHISGLEPEQQWKNPLTQCNAL